VISFCLLLKGRKSDCWSSKLYRNFQNRSLTFQYL